MATSARRAVHTVRLPSDVTLTITILLQLMRKFETIAIEGAVDFLINELDGRAGDLDLEDDADEDSE